MTGRRWTYKVVDIKGTFNTPKADVVQDALNQLGLQGWELVSALQVSMSIRLYLKKEQ